MAAGGQIGFHTRPAPAYLATWAPEGVEIGFKVYPAWRRLGYAREAVRGMIRWAHDTWGIAQFVASVAPDNAASTSLVLGQGFVAVGQWDDEIDGEEVVHLLEGEGLRRLLAATPHARDDRSPP